MLVLRRIQFSLSTVVPIRCKKEKKHSVRKCSWHLPPLPPFSALDPAPWFLSGYYLLSRFLRLEHTGHGVVEEQLVVARNRNSDGLEGLALLSQIDQFAAKIQSVVVGEACELEMLLFDQEIGQQLGGSFLKSGHFFSWSFAGVGWGISVFFLLLLLAGDKQRGVMEKERER